MNVIGIRSEAASPLGMFVRVGLVVAASIVPNILDIRDASAQLFRPLRSRSVVVARRPVVAVPVYPAYPSSAVRVRTPYFSLSVGGLSVGADLPYTSSYSLYGDRFDAYDPLYRYRGTSGLGTLDGYRLPYDYWGDIDPRNPYLAQRVPREERRNPVYSPGAGGGIPDLTDPEPIEVPERSTVSQPTESINPYFTPNAFADEFDADKLRDAVSLFSESIRRQKDAVTWLEFLRPSSILSGLDIGADPSVYQELSERYEGVVRNPSLARISLLPGFDTTRRQLAAWVASAATPPVDAESVEREFSESDGTRRGAAERELQDIFNASPSGAAPADEPNEIELLPPPSPEG